MQMGVRRAAPSEAGRGRAGQASAVAWAPGACIGGAWRLGRLLKSGRVNEVWSARAADGTRVALKTPRADRSEHRAACDAIRHEFDVLAAVRHPHIVTAHALTGTPDRPALVVEYLGGGDLTSLAGAPVGHWLEALRGVVAALAELHAHDLVHRDLKARNVMFDAANCVRLIDLASVRRSGTAVTIAGTSAAHRRAGAQTADVRDDIHALAVLLHELLSGRLPPPGGRVGPLVPGGDRVSRRLERWVLGELERGPGRTTNLRELADVIEFDLPSESSPL